MRMQLLIALAAMLNIAGTAASGATTKPRAPAALPYFVPMAEIAVPIVSLDRVEATLEVTVMIEARTAEAAEGIARAMPKLRTAALAAALEFGRLHASGLTAVDARRLGADLSKAMRRAQPGVARVLIIEVAARPT